MYKSVRKKNMKPLLSIVIANYNYGRFLEEAIRSVIEQDGFDLCELIVVDGGSTDNSVEVIKKYERKIAWWVSEPDKGQSDAFNKGFAQAKGRFLTWLNADDVMLPQVVKHLRASVERYPDCQWFTGGCFWLDSEMRIIKCSCARPFSVIRWKCGCVSVYGPSSFFEKSLLDSVGGIDVRFHYTMDTDLWFRFAQHGVRYRQACNFAFGLRFHQASKTTACYFKDGNLDIDSYDWEKDPKRDVVTQERKWMRSGYSLKEYTWWRRVVSVSWLCVIRNKINSLALRGRSYKIYRG